MLKFIKKWLELILVIISGTFTYFGQSDYVIKFVYVDVLGKPLNQIDKIKESLLIIGVIAITIIPIITIRRLKKKVDRYHSQQEFLLKELKDMFFIRLDSIAKGKFGKIKIRLFIIKRRIKGFKIKQIARTEHIEGLTDINNFEKFELELYPKEQGLVGKSYSKKQIVYDDKLSITNEKNYNLNHYHESRTKDFEFCVCVPIFGEQDKVIAVMALDSNSKINLTESQKKEFFKILSIFSNKFYGKLNGLIK